MKTLMHNQLSFLFTLLTLSTVALTSCEKQDAEPMVQRSITRGTDSTSADSKTDETPAPQAKPQWTRQYIDMYPGKGIDTLTINFYHDTLITVTCRFVDSTWTLPLIRQSITDVTTGEHQKYRYYTMDYTLSEVQRSKQCDQNKTVWLTDIDDVTIIDKHSYHFEMLNVCTRAFAGSDYKLIQ